MKKNLLRAGCVAGVMALGLSACGSSGGSGSSSDKKLELGMAVANISLNFASSMADGAKQAAAHSKNVDLKVVGPPNTDGPAEQALFSSLVKTATDGVVLENLDPPIFTRPAAQAVQSGVKVVALDTSPTDGSKVDLYVGNDNYELGQMLADETLKNLGSNTSGTVVVGVPNPGTPVLDSRAKGIKDELEAKAPNIKVLGPYQTYSDPSQNFGAWQSLVNAHSGALAYLGVGDADSYDLAKIKQQQGGKYLVAGFDVDAKTLEYVKQGVLFCTLDPEHFLKGYIAMKLLIDGNRGKKMPTGWFKTTGLVVNSANVDSIIARQKSPTAAYDFYEKQIDSMLGDEKANLKPLKDAR
ncbi:sugar ABC transporter substrate-binding protein [Nocardioides mangrovicus]|uniref:Sugar ABC transporter substrate-binding protein n=1 Tax=Nocardioides mangrovicus TaxID=2478913 RepID=A0A3L8NWZ9_9ACTN|nr:sugar ABC transporter substrate-binding protein [Nocardioides mangrovicus]RLV47695.1 sugar ABC transporter substrate-binding protein [Nocardioides mangrovicus]